jgi:hypothetical protein
MKTKLAKLIISSEEAEGGMLWLSEKGAKGTWQTCA